MGEEDWIQDVGVERVGPGGCRESFYGAGRVCGGTGIKEDEGGEMEALGAVALRVDEVLHKLVAHFCGRCCLDLLISMDR